MWAEREIWTQREMALGLRRLPGPTRQRSRRSMRGFRFILALVALTALPSLAAAQQVFIGRVVEEGTGRPVAAAFVSVQGPSGARVVAGLTGPNGSFRLQTPRTAPGPYTLTAQRIGYGTAHSGPRDVEAGEPLDVTLVMPSDAIPLEGIEAVGVRRCGLDPEEGLRIHELWTEARKALEIAAWAATDGRLTFQGRRYERLSVLATGRVVTERSWLVDAGARPPFLSAPALELLEEGYVRPAPGVESFVYFAPDAQVVLSDAFLDAYCFRVLGPDQSPPGLTGLGFEPAERRDRPDITGVLWVDSDSGTLGHLEFQYTRHLQGYPVPPWLHPVFGGRVDFRELPNGVWVVDRWSLFMPEYQGRQLAVIRDWNPVRRAAQGFVAARSLRPDVQIAPAHQIPRRDRDLVSLLGVREVGGELVIVEGWREPGAETRLPLGPRPTRAPEGGPKGELKDEPKVEPTLEGHHP